MLYGQGLEKEYSPDRQGNADPHLALMENDFLRIKTVESNYQENGNKETS